MTNRNWELKKDSLENGIEKDNLVQEITLPIFFSISCILHLPVHELSDRNKHTKLVFSS
jgi:hypothetical protein